MTDDIPDDIERRRNPARKKTAGANIVYSIEWNDARRAFEVFREGVSTGAFAGDKASAVRTASRAAQFEAREEIKVVVRSISDGRVVVEWSN